MEKMRLDKWLWAARFYKTRSLAAREIGNGRVMVNEQPAKAAREIAPGDEISMRRHGLSTIVRVRALSAMRGPATQARTLYEETAESRAQREQAMELRRLAPEPADSLRAGRPTKRERRQITEWRNRVP